MRGIFVVFEGIDGSGKTTQARLLCDFVSEMGRECVLVREPGGTEIGEKIRDILLRHDMFPETELFLFLASRSQLVREVIIPALEAGKVVIADRFSYSSVAYQGFGRGMDIEFVDLANSVATSNLKPDLVFYIDLSVEDAMGRKGFRDRMEKVSFLERVHAGYAEMAKRGNFIVLDGREEAHRIHEEIRKRFLELIGRDGS